MLHHNFYQPFETFFQSFASNFLFISPVQYIVPDPSDVTVLRGHKLPVTCAVVSSDDKFIFSASKDASLIKCKFLRISIFFFFLYNDFKI